VSVIVAQANEMADRMQHDLKSAREHDNVVAYVVPYGPATRLA
jgi:hypothetical protein